MLLLLLVGVTVPLLLLLDCVVLDGTTELFVPVVLWVGDGTNDVALELVVVTKIDVDKADDMRELVLMMGVTVLVDCTLRT